MNISIFSKKKKNSRKSALRKGAAKYGIALFNIALVLTVVSFLIYGKNSSKTVSESLNSQTDTAQGVVALDQISSADIAANIAVAVGLPEANQVRNQADSRNALVAIAVSDDVIVNKPQIVTNETTGSQGRKDISEYVVNDGDSVQTVAEKYNVSSDSIRWSNGITGDKLTSGKTIMVPPKNRNGLVYKVTEADTLDKLAEKYKTTKEKIVTFNDFELSTGLPINEYIFIPDGEKAPDPVPVNNNYGSNFVFVGKITAQFGSNGYANGYCTWWAAERRAQLGAPIPSNLGNAITWVSIAQSLGYETGDSPRNGAVVWFRFPATYAGHVAIVESVNEDGSFEISEMNGRAGWGNVGRYTIPASETGNYRFIY